MNKNYIMPKYMSKFRCIGGACEDNCCTLQWDILIDRKTVNKYYSTSNNNIREIAQRSIQIHNTEIEKESYGKIVSQDKNQQICGFCNKDGYCQIHSTLGEDALSKTCYTYPKVLNIIDGQPELSASLSCPEVVRLVLFEEDSMELIQEERGYNTDQLTTYASIDTQTVLRHTDSNGLFWAIRGLAFRIMSIRNYSIGKRLILLGLFHSKLNKLEKKEMFDVISNYHNSLNEPQSIEFNDIDINYGMQLEFTKQLIKMIKDISTEELYSTYRSVMELVERGYKKYDSDIEKAYTPALEYYMEHEEKYRLILENYILNYVFQELYPFNIQTDVEKINDVEKSYIALVLDVALIKVHLIGLCTYFEGEIPNDIIVSTIQGIVKVVKHNRHYKEAIVGVELPKDLEGIKWLGSFIKNQK